MSAAVGAVIVGTAIASFGQPKPGENTIAAHVAAAHAAADDTWLILFSELCGGAMGFGGRASSLPPALLAAGKPALRRGNTRPTTTPSKISSSTPC